jgi:transposase
MQESNLPRRQYTDEFKIEAIRLAESIGGHEAARRLGVPVATVGNWKRLRAAAGTIGSAAPEVTSSAAAVPTRRPVSELEAENSRLRRELADAKLDVEILRKATAYFAKGSR